MKNYKMWIDGKWVDAESGKTFSVVNPATEEEIARVPLGGTADVDKAVNAAKKAFPSWSGKSQAERSRIAGNIGVEIMKNVPELVEIDILDHGTPRAYAHLVVANAAQYFEWASHASLSLTGDILPVDPKKKVLLQREPVGVSALIIPWNVPLVVAAMKLSQAMTVGNTCVVKPPSIDSLEILKLAEILEKLGIPPGVVNVITGPGSSVGEALAAHPGVDLIGFTGSCDTGKRIMSLASQSMKRIQLELGGKNPVIVLKDANVEMAATRSVMVQYFNAGQVCGAAGRFYIHEKIYDEFVDKFVSGTKQLTVGNPSDAGTLMGPLVSAEHRTSVEKLIKSGLDEGARMVLGGKAPLDKGYFVMPTVFTDVKQNMTIAREEIFGPVACIMERFSSEDEVIDLANDNTFGLCATVWTRDNAKAMKFADRLAAGTVWINHEGALAPEMPWGGFKESGFGKEGSKYGLEDFTRLKMTVARL